MHKIDTDTAVDGEFVSGSSSTGQQATKLNASWFNTVQRELSNIVEKAGMALSKTDDGQIFSAFFKYIKDKGISGIKKAFSFSDESSHRTLNVDASGIKFTQDIDSCTVSLNDGSLYFDGTVAFEGSVAFEDGVEGNLTVGTNAVVGGNLNVGANAVVGGNLNVEGRLKSTSTARNELQNLSVGDLSSETPAVTLKDGNVYAGGNVVAGGFIRTDSTLQNEMENLHVKSSDGNVSIHNGMVGADDSVRCKRLVTNVYASKSALPSMAGPYASLAAYQSGDTWKLCFWNGSSWNDV